MNLKVPEGCTARIALPRLSEGSMKNMLINGEKVILSDYEVGICTILRKTMPAFEITQGDYLITFE